MFEKTKQGVVDLVRGEEPLDSDHIAQVIALLGQCLEEGPPRVVLDLEKVPLIDSAGLETLLDCQENFQLRGGALKLVGPNPLCKEILSVTGVGRHFEVFPEASSAVSSFAQ